MQAPYMGIFFMENAWKPTTQASRITVTQLPIEVSLFIWSVVNKYNLSKLLRGQRAYASRVNFTKAC